MTDISDFVGKTFVQIMVNNGDELLFFLDETGTSGYRMYHSQDCCEYVSIEEIIGDLDDLVGTPILEARKDTSDDPAPAGHSDDAEQWTFYNIRTIKGSVTIRWFGSSNGYYSVDVSIDEIKPHNRMRW